MTAPRRFARDGERLAAALRAAAAEFPGDEANFRRAAERALEDIASEHGVELQKRYELILETGGRADAVFNRLIVEWEPPGSMTAHSTSRANKHAVGQLQGYVDGLAARERRELDRLLGVACDGRFMIFARYRAGHWIVDEPVPVDGLSAEQLLESLVAAQAGRALIADNLLKDFGSGTNLTRQLSRDLLELLNERIGHEPDGLAARLFTQWRELFAVATGVVGEREQLSAEQRRALAQVFGLRPRDLEPARALFALQTYFSIVTKLIALLAVSLWVEGVELWLDELKDAGDAELREDLEEIQTGAPFRRAGLLNVIEPDVFGWYLDWNSSVRDGIRTVLGKLAEYDPKTLQVSPEDARDLLKDLYQGLLPRPVRHALGQYFTPDWLARQLLEQVGYEGDPKTRLVDPSCGTGTFLVLAIARLKERLRKDGVTDRQALEVVLRNVVGFDIDPLATVAARTNYVLALGSLLRAAPERHVDVPVYLADSIVMPALGETLFTGDRLELETAVGTFALPVCVDTGDGLRQVCDFASELVYQGRAPDEFVARAAPLCGADAEQSEVLRAFYELCLEQHRKGLDGLWPHVLRNAFMPAFIGRFDLVVGNPPWVNWESLPTAYRERTRPLWERMGLFVHGGMQALLGSGKKDVSMLMSYVVTDRLLRDGGRLGFVITQTVFKTSGAGQGFRRFRIGDLGPAVRVEQVDDLVDLNPFVGATNRTALFTWTKGKPTKYPVPYVLWQRTQSRRIRAGATDEEVTAMVRPVELVATPVGTDDPTSAWVSLTPDALTAIRAMTRPGPRTYVAHEGVNTGGANGIYWVSVDGAADRSGRLPITNLHDIGRRAVPKKHGRVERQLVYPMIRGRDIRRWAAKPSLHILMTQDPKTRTGIDESAMRTTYPGALEFLEQFESELRARSAFRRFFTRPHGHTTVDTGHYWSMFNVGEYTFAKHKVAWKYQAADFAASVLPTGTPLPIPNEKCMFVAVESNDEAHYLCAIFNSAPVRLFVAAYTVNVQIGPHVLRYLDVPRFDPNRAEHRKIAASGRAASSAVAAGRQPDQDNVDRAVAKLWKLSSSTVQTMKKMLDLLLKRDLAEE